MYQIFFKKNKLKFTQLSNESFISVQHANCFIDDFLKEKEDELKHDDSLEFKIVKIEEILSYYVKDESYPNSGVYINRHHEPYSSDTQRVITI